MISLTYARFIWPLAVILYLAMQPIWDYLRWWALGWPGQWVKSLRRSSFGEALGTLGKMLYSLGIPYAALLLGFADARRLGLAGLPWWPQFPYGVLIGLAGLTYLRWSWKRLSAIGYQRSRHTFFLAEWQAFHRRWDWGHLLLDVLCLEMSWAFVRGVVVQLLGPYTGVLVGLALVGAAWLLRPDSIPSLSDPDERARVLLTGQLAVVTALVFLFSENLWLCVFFHGLGLLAVTLAAGRAYVNAEALA